MSTGQPDPSEPADLLDAIAIVGIACRFPGADNTEEFWRNLRDGVESITPVSVQEMLDAGLDPAEARHPKRVAAASALADVGDFDAGFFGFSPRQAELTDPQHRLFLECAWEALESAGYDPAAWAGKIGVFAGSSISTYLLSNLYPSMTPANRSSDLQVLIGNDKDYLATQAAYKLGLTGPALNVQTACSTSLVAVHLACQSLLNHECDLALAGGVTVRLPERSGYRYEEGGILSPDGHCRPFDASAQGTVFGSGAGIVVLKRLADALADGDLIDAVIKGSAVNNDGALKAGYTAPSEGGQAEVVADALAIAGVGPDTISYVEAHGTGTPIGDPIEIAALTRAFRSRAGARPLEPGTCAVGAVKSNVGHLESAAGIAGLLKTVLALTHRQIPPTLNYTRPNPAISFAGTPFYVSTRLSEWPSGPSPRRAGVSAFGIGGTNAHLVVEEAPAVPARGEEAGIGGTGRPYLLPLSARDPAALADLARRYEGFLAADQPGGRADPTDMCWSASRRRRHHEYRMAVVGRSHDELRARLASAADEQSDLPGPAHSTRRPRLVFVFPGQGSQWAGMSRQLLQHEPVFRTAVQQCDQLISHYTGWSLLAQLTRDDGDGSWLERTDRVQLALFAIQVGLAAWWRSVGVEPDAVVGHSMGEIAAAHVAGALSLDDAVRIIFQRNRLIEEVLGQGKMLATSLTPDQARALLTGHEAQASVAIINSPRSTVLSGDPAFLESIAATLRGQGTFHRWVNVNFAAHSPQIDLLLTRLQESLQGLSPHTPAIPLVSTVTGGPLGGTELDAAYWARNLRDPVLFADATRWLAEHDHDVFLEISPHPVLLPSIEDSLYHLGRPGVAVPSVRRDSDEQQSLLEAAGALYRTGHAIRWDLLYPQAGRYLRLPSYPWQRHRYWVDPPREHPLTAGGTPAVHPLLGRKLRSPLAEVQFESDVSVPAAPYLDDHRVCGRAVFPAAAYLDLLAQAAQDGGPHLLTDVVMHDLLTLGDSAPRRLQTVLTPASDGSARIELFGSDRAGTGWQLYVTAQAAAGPPGSDPLPPDLDEVRGRCPREIPVAAFYERLHQLGLEYGPQFRGIESIRAGSGEALGQVRLPATLAAEAGRYGVHPALLDACLQLTGAAMAGTDLAATPPGGDGRADVYLPASVESFHVAIPGQTQVTGHALIRGETGGPSATGDVRLYGERGQLVAQVLGLQVKKVSQAALRTALMDDLNDWFFELRWRPQPQAAAAAGPPGAPDERGGRWLILAGGDGVGQALADQLDQRGDAATIVVPGARYRHEAGGATFEIDPAQPEDFTRMLAADGAAYRGVIYLWALDATPAEHTTADSLVADEALACGGALHLAQAMVRRTADAPPPLWLVTRGAQSPPMSAEPSAPAQAPLWGLGRTLRTEHPDLPCVLVDLDIATAGDNARTLLAETAAVRLGNQEDQVSFRRKERFVARLTRSAPQSRAEPALSLMPSGPAIQLVIPARGTLDDLTLGPAERRAPAAGEVEIRVRATGLNFRDVLNALGAYPGDPGPLGLECAGEISAVGAGVEEFGIGDAVVALGHGCFGTFVTAQAALVARKPGSLSYAEAATIPISFLTAAYSLRQLAKISPGDTILIHAAAGGLGLAATQLARQAGAEVLGTAGNDQKRGYLRSLGLRHVMDSRTLGFAAEVNELTGGRGVDIVLNSLNGEYIPRSLSVLAAGGRFVEVGKIGIWDSEQVRQARPDASYFVVDLDAEARRNPAAIGGMLRQLMGDFENGTLHPLPRHIFALQETARAFRFMAQARQTGKIVITQEVGLSGAPGDGLRSDASYLITGGLGGLGLQVARWMAGQGARHLALAGRSGPSTEAQAAVEELTRAGVQVLVISADAAQAGQVARALEEISAAMPPLRGVVHAAGILDDGILLHQDWDRFARVLAPKVQGAWNLHAQTRSLPLDFFVMFSSIAALWGSAGQSSYAAANAFQDALAHTRRAQGLPALSINWGAWSQVGLAARTAVTGRLSEQHMSPIAPGAGVRALGQAIGQQAAQLAVVPIDWAGFLARLPAGRIPPLLAELSREPQPAPAGERPAAGRSLLLRRLDAASTGNRRRVLAAYLDEQARLALGLDPQVPLDPRRPLGELGLDSLMAIELRGRLSSACGHVLPATVLFDYPTVEGLAGYLADDVLRLSPGGAASDHGAAGALPAAATREHERHERAADVEHMSDYEVEAGLAEELAAVQALLSGGQQ